MTWFELYMWTRLDAIDSVVFAVMITAWIAVCALAVVRACIASEMMELIEEMADNCPYDSRKGSRRQRLKHMHRLIKPCNRYMKISAAVATVALIVSASLPSKSDLALIQGMTWATNNSDVKAIPDDAVKLIREWLNEARPNRKESKP